MHACINVLPLLYPFGLLSCLDYCRWCCCDDWGYMYLLAIVFLFSLVRCPEVKLLDHIVVPFVVFFEKPQYCFPWWLHQFAFPLGVHKGALFFISLQVFAGYCLFDGGYSDRCDRVSQCDFDIHFSEGWWCWVPVGYLCVFFFGEVAVLVLCLFLLFLLLWLGFSFLLLRCMSISINHWDCASLLFHWEKDCHYVIVSELPSLRTLKVAVFGSEKMY